MSFSILSKKTWKTRTQHFRAANARKRGRARKRRIGQIYKTIETKYVTLCREHIIDGAENILHLHF